MTRKRSEPKYAPKELAESFVFPVKLTRKQQREAGEQLAAARIKVQATNTEADLLRSSVLQLRFQIEEYLKENTFQPEMSFGNMLKRYITLQNKKRNVFAGEISIDDTLLSQLINGHRTSPDYMAIRLELHSANLIPADLWYQLIERERQYFIRTDKELRKVEKQHVKVRLPL